MCLVGVAAAPVLVNELSDAGLSEDNYEDLEHDEKLYVHQGRDEVGLQFVVLDVLVEVEFASLVSFEKTKKLFKKKLLASKKIFCKKKCYS